NNNSYSNKIAYQKVTFYRGLELFNQEKYTEAKSYFNKSLNETQDGVFVARATFWKAETDYNLGKYQEAVIEFKEFKESACAYRNDEYKKSDYNIAYTYFNQKE